MVVVTGWLIVVMVILALVGFQWMKGLSDSVLIALLGTTTINVIALSAIILKGLFKNKENKSS